MHVFDMHSAARSMIPTPATGGRGEGNCTQKRLGCLKDDDRVFVRVCVCTFVRARVCACVRARVCACVCACVVACVRLVHECSFELECMHDAYTDVQLNAGLALFLG